MITPQDFNHRLRSQNRAQNKLYHMKVLLERFYLNGHTFDHINGLKSQSHPFLLNTQKYKEVFLSSSIPTFYFSNHASEFHSQVDTQDLLCRVDHQDVILGDYFFFFLTVASYGINQIRSFNHNLHDELQAHFCLLPLKFQNVQNFLHIEDEFKTISHSTEAFILQKRY